MKLLILQSFPASHHFLHLRFKFPLSTLFSDTINPRSTFSMSYQVSHPYKTEGKIVVLYILILSF